MALTQAQIYGIIFCIFVVMPVSLFFGLRYLARRYLPKRAPQVATQVSATGFVFFALQTLFFLLCAIDFELFPTGRVGELMHEPGGKVVVFVLGYIGFSIVGAILTRLGHPPTRIKKL